ncbi:efflux RND transporter periplasmic adaptor subunit [Gloeothece verrucosa]|uniref:Efflux transporter, RND family, MFP subunit n=1 Tax=Gloeothece verrucosa (strain PCC 7822) TaxID=497965 RepID=E0UDL1_GLOV7|nr:efflux RND transporter periplasmic adaptor subunit [Gloeothece verrucosa]ADN15324.1 efflux transporter, RND family, MFP subunit [Gloeothece verrucosa PCC 7822]
MDRPKSKNYSELSILEEIDDIEVAYQEKTAKKPKKQRGGPNWSLILSLLLVLGGAGWGWTWWTSSSRRGEHPSEAFAQQPQAIPVKLATLQSETVQKSTEVLGSLEARRSVNLKPEVDGRITQILVREGDRVEVGQVIVRLDSDDLQAQVAQAKAKLENAKAKLGMLEAGSRIEDIAEARANLNQALARLADAKKGARPEAIAQAEAQLDAAQSEAELAQNRVKRYKQLEEEGAVSIDEYQGYLQQAKSATAAVREAERRLAEAQKSRQSDIDEQEAQVEQARQNLRRLENGPRSEEIAQARADVSDAAANLQNAQVALQKTNVTAPFAGVIGDIPIKLGDYVKEGDQLTTITENNVLEVNLQIPLQDAQKLRLGLPVEILNSQGQIITTGKISFIAPNVSANSQLILAKAAIPNVLGELLNLQFIQARIIWDQRPGILVPSAAISRIGGATFVFVAQQAPESTNQKAPKLIAKQRPVKLGELQGNNYQILEGLQPGEKVVTAGILNLADGAPILPQS